MSPPHADDLCPLSLADAAEAVRTRAVSPLELTRACLERIERLNPRINAFITVTAELALEQARAAEAEIMRGQWRGPLHGIPLALKDLFDTAGIKTTAASAVFAERVPTEDAEVVCRLKTAGAVLLGKLNLHEFAYGGSGLISAFGPVRNPWDRAHITGGSSSGSAAAVAAELCYGALGTDTAGSIRLPAAYCGIVGMKPSYGLVSARGVIPLSWSYDHVGPMARTVADTALLLQAIAGYDHADISSQPSQVPNYAAALEGGTSSLRLGIPRHFFYAELDAEVEAKVEKAIEVLAGIAAVAREIELPVDTDRTVATAEDYAYHEQYVSKCSHLYDPETLRRLVRGAEISAAAYIQRRRELDRMRRSAGDVFEEVDVLVTPTVPILAPTFAELEGEPKRLRERELVMLRNTRPFNVLGLPAISVPCGVTEAGLPVGLQITGPPGGDATVLRLAHAYEQVSGRRRRPPALS